MNYGGYVVSMTLYADRISRLFRCALVGAPIERLMSSLSFYAERYMGTSIDIYKNSSIDYNLADLTHRSVYLVHGRLNTDFERTTDLLEMFTRAGVPRARHVSGVLSIGIICLITMLFIIVAYSIFPVLVVPSTAESTIKI